MHNTHSREAVYQGALETYTALRENLLHQFSAIFFDLTVEDLLLTEFSLSSLDENSIDPILAISYFTKLGKAFLQIKQSSNARKKIYERPEATLQLLYGSFIKKLSEEEVRFLIAVCDVIEHNDILARKTQLALQVIRSEAEVILGERGLYLLMEKRYGSFYRSIGVLPPPQLTPNTLNGGNYSVKKFISPELAESEAPLSTLFHAAIQEGWTKNRWQNVPQDKYATITVLGMNLHTITRILYEKEIIPHDLDPTRSYGDFKLLGDYIFTETEDILKAKDAYREKYSPYMAYESQHFTTGSL